jgi:hypothetical protein
MSRPALKPTQLPTQWLPGSFPGVKQGLCLTLTTVPPLKTRSRMSRSYTPFLLGACMAAGQLYLLYFLHFRWYQLGELSLLAFNLSFGGYYID